MPSRLFIWSLTAALAGFLFGFDTVVISGAEKTIQELWSLGEFEHGLAMSMALWGTVFGSLIGGYPTDRFGRKATLLWIGIFYVVSAVWSGLATDVYSFMVARFIGGVGVGISTVAAPLYISEIAPPERRGRLAGMFQFNIVFGILVAFASNAAIAGIGPNAWRWMLGVEAIPAVIYSLMCIGLPESPRWLIVRRGDVARAKQTIAAANPDATEAHVNDLAEQIETSRDGQATRGGFWNLRLRGPVSWAFLIAFFNQLSGINAILYFAPRIFEKAGMGEQTALLQSIGIGVTNLIFTFVGLWLIDRLGRRTLMFVGSIGYIASLGLCAWAFQSETFAIVPMCIFAFIAAHAVGQGAVIWVFISEIFPNQYRAVGQSLGSFTHWIFAALLTLFFPSMVTAFPASLVFLFFCLMMVIQLLWVIFVMPETKGVPLEQIERKYAASKSTR
ncbi:putative metabolite transport protein CsbC [Rubripirellula lacrimiformis]|uniref:Putative metabolite transport protein CsbC n=1 Tax=Rubripirellula lacrimiformis TaxID=1930273 RepID=A0A517NAG7_9BACT|nr:sugar porter family MFS transporter [Rubripirellula lacrimiformis]QDT04125.1 putative metabolite transport protein CsbC [Rubripirellula lacrimiformis]